jgi:hypothetical protein
LVKKQNQRNSLPQHTQSSQCRPRTRIHKMISMMWSICCTCLNSFFLQKRSFLIIFVSIQKIQNHFFEEKKNRKKLKNKMKSNPMLLFAIQRQIPMSK